MITIIVVAIVVTAYKGFDFYKDYKTMHIPQIKWSTQATQLFQNEGYTKLHKIKASQIKAQALPPHLEKLQGNINNPFGIRDDILDFIVKNVPSNNEKLMRASIEFAQIEQDIYYGNPSKQDAINLAGSELLLATCISQYTNNYGSNDLTSRIGGMMRDTKERDQHMWDIDRKYFSWQVIGTGLSVADENIVCQKGDF